jgi:hypothetical protein
MIEVKDTVRFISDRALDARNTYCVGSVSLVARKTA